MTECEKAQELIGCQLDGELADADKARLEAHLASCPACTAYRDLLADIALERKDPPASLLPNVMDAVRKAPRPKNVLARRWATGAVAAAACLAVIALASLPSLTGSKTETSLASPAGGASGVSVSRSAGGSAAPLSAPDAPAAARYDYAANEAAAPREAPLPAPSEAPDEAPASMPEPGFPAAAGPAEAAAEPDGEAEELVKTDYAAVVYVNGEWPEALADYELRDLDDGSFAAVVPLDLVSELPADVPSVRNAAPKNADEALVIYTP